MLSASLHVPTIKAIVPNWISGLYAIWTHPNDRFSYRCAVHHRSSNHQIRGNPYAISNLCWSGFFGFVHHGTAATTMTPAEHEMTVTAVIMLVIAIIVLVSDFLTNRFK